MRSGGVEVDPDEGTEPQAGPDGQYHQEDTSHAQPGLRPDQIGPTKHGHGSVDDLKRDGVTTMLQQICSHDTHHEPTSDEDFLQ